MEHKRKDLPDSEPEDLDFTSRLQKRAEQLWSDTTPPSQLKVTPTPAETKSENGPTEAEIAAFEQKKREARDRAAARQPEAGQKQEIDRYPGLSAVGVGVDLSKDPLTDSRYARVRFFLACTRCGQRRWSDPLAVDQPAAQTILEPSLETQVLV
jgi:hypothetical protein